MMIGNGSRPVRKLVFAALVATLPLACGSSSSTSAPTAATPPQPTAAPCTQSVVYEGSGPLPSRFLEMITFSTGTAGRVDVTVDWTFATSVIGVWLVPSGTCSIDQLNARSCNFLIRSESGG